MKIIILAVGKPKTEFYEPAIAEYQKRLSRWTTLDWQTVPASNITKESQQLMKMIPVDSTVILLDERGVQWSTPQLAAKLENYKNISTKNLLFIIGGAYGVSDEFSNSVDELWSLSNLVFPHEQVRLMLAEQLYRAHDLNAGGSYHHK